MIRHGCLQRNTDWFEGKSNFPSFFESKCRVVTRICCRRGFAPEASKTFATHETPWQPASNPKFFFADGRWFARFLMNKSPCEEEEETTCGKEWITGTRATRYEAQLGCVSITKTLWRPSNGDWMMHMMLEWYIKNEKTEDLSNKRLSSQNRREIEKHANGLRTGKRKTNTSRVHKNPEKQPVTVISLKKFSFRGSIISERLVIEEM